MTPSAASPTCAKTVEDRTVTAANAANFKETMLDNGWYIELKSHGKFESERQLAMCFPHSGPEKRLAPGSAGLDIM